MRQLIPLGRASLLALLLVLLTTGGAAAQNATPGLLITEVQAANTRTVADDRGRYTDWIELYNPTAAPISLTGYTLTDDSDEPAKWALPATTLAPGAFLLVWASGADRVGAAGWHTNFRLRRGGEYVGLFGPDGQVVDEVTFDEQQADVSLGRLPGSDQWLAFPLPTPGGANTTGPRAVLDAPQVLVTPGSGFFTGPVTIQLVAPAAPGSTVYYTLDGTDPTVDGLTYMEPVAITETTVLRAVALDEGGPVSAVTTATYLVGESTGLPVVSLVTEPAHLWDETRSSSRSGYIFGGTMDHASWHTRCLGQSRVRRTTGWSCEPGAATVGCRQGLRQCTCGTNWCGTCTGRWDRWRPGGAG